MSKKKNGRRRTWFTYKDVLNAYRDPNGKGLRDVEAMLKTGELGKQALKKCAEHLQSSSSGKVHPTDAPLLAFCQDQGAAKGVPRPELGETRPYASYTNGKAHTPFVRAPLYHFPPGFKAGDPVNVTFEKNRVILEPAS